jgi:hypothetical protein
VVLTRAASGVVRSRPSWQSATIVFAEKRPDGTSALVGVEANGCDRASGPALRDVPMDTGDNTSYIDLAPSSPDRTGPNFRFVFQHEEPSGSEVWIEDNVSRGGRTEKLAAGSEPALSPDGRKLAYVAPNGQIVVRPEYYKDTTVQVTRSAEKPSRLTWTPDGSRIVYRTAKDIESVPADAPNATPTALADKPGVPTVVRTRFETVNRISGADPIALAIAASQAYWPTVSTAYMSQGFSGAHSAILTAPGVLPGQVDGSGPLLLTAGDALDPRTHAEMKRMFGSWSDPNLAPHITIVGGTDVISAKVAEEIARRGYKVNRVAVGAAAAPSGDTACAPQNGLGAALANQVLVVVNGAAKANLAVAVSLGEANRSPVLVVDPAAGLTDAAKQWLARSSATLNTTYLLDPDGTGIPAGLERQITELVSGPLGSATQGNPTVKPLN